MSWDVLEAVEKLAKAVAESGVMKAEPKTAEEAMALYAALGEVENAASNRRKALRDKLVVTVQKAAPLEVSEGTSAHRAKYPLAEASVSVGASRSPDVDGLIALMGERGFSPQDVCDVVHKYMYNVSKVEHLLEHGHISKAEIDELAPPTLTLKVKATGPLQKACDNLKKNKSGA